MPNKTWKKHELRVAAKLNGRRVGNSGRNTEDVTHAWLSIECKARKSLPAWLKTAMTQARVNADEDKLPIVVLHERNQRSANDLVVIRMADFQEWFANDYGGEYDDHG